MDFKVKTFKELLGMKFNIPSYQRGYRWEKENVEALLNDIQEFAEKKDKEPGEFYCLQPVVVKKNKKLSEDADIPVYDLLDGQQRLTTLWLILNTPTFKSLWSYFEKKHLDPYSMQYESRKNLFSQALDDKTDPLDNIDLFYLKKAYDTIMNWDGDPLKILTMLVPKKTDVDTANVRIIWYEFEDSEDLVNDKQTSSIKVFSRLNYGKIALTDTELIKALILQSDIYPDDNSLRNRNVMREHLFRIATEWDDIEKGLHEEMLWGMLTTDEYNPVNHMELLLRFVAEQIQMEKKYKIIDYQRRDFHIISNFLGINSNIIPEEYAHNVDLLWTRIRDAYNAIRNWYVNDDFYHLIGLYILMQGGSNPISLIKVIFDKYSSPMNEKENFKAYLEGEIGKAIRITEKEGESSEDGKRLLKLHELVYGEHNQRIIRILEALNIYLYLQNKFIGSRFNFKKFKEFKVTSLEHIHPQHLNFQDDVEYDDVKTWFNNTKEIVTSNAGYSSNDTIIKALTSLEELLANKKQFNNVVSQCQEAVEAIDAFFDKKANMSEGHMHTLYNLTLVDKDTNAALSNNLIDVKRSILHDRENKNKTYVPLATNYVFNKYFSNSVSDMRFWTKEDREIYFSFVEKSYNYFTCKIKEYGKSK